MQQIVINNVYGGFTVYDEIYTRMRMVGYEGGLPERDNPIFVEVVKYFISANGGKHYYGLVVVEIPDDVDWQIEEYDGMEWVAEKHRTWGE